MTRRVLDAGGRTSPSNVRALPLPGVEAITLHEGPGRSQARAFAEALAGITVVGSKIVVENLQARPRGHLLVPTPTYSKLLRRFATADVRAFRPLPDRAWHGHVIVCGFGDGLIGFEQAAATKRSLGLGAARSVWPSSGRSSRSADGEPERAGDVGGVWTPWRSRLPRAVGAGGSGVCVPGENLRIT